VLALVLAALVASPAAAPSEPAITLDVRGKACALDRALVAPLGELGLRVVPRDRPATLALRVDVEARTLRVRLVRSGARTSSGAVGSGAVDALVERALPRAPTCGADVDTLTWVVEAQLRDLGFTPPPRARRSADGREAATGPGPRAELTPPIPPPAVTTSAETSTTRSGTLAPTPVAPNTTRTPPSAEPAEPAVARTPDVPPVRDLEARPRLAPAEPTDRPPPDEPTEREPAGATPNPSDAAGVPTEVTRTATPAPTLRAVEAALELGGDVDAATAPRVGLRAALVLASPVALVDALAVGLRVTLGLPTDADVLVRDELRGTLTLARGALDLTLGPRWTLGPGTFWVHALVGAELARATTGGPLLFRAVDATRVIPLVGAELGYRLDTRWGPILGPSLGLGVASRPGAPSFGVEDASARLAVPPASLQLRAALWFGGGE
jgi:hypothetical protein